MEYITVNFKDIFGKYTGQISGFESTGYERGFWLIREVDKTGGCACGAVRYRVSAKPLSVHACHCTDCQALSGSAFGLSMVLNRTELEITQGEVGVNEFSASKNLMHRHYCKNCGVALWFSSPGYEGIIAVKPGTLDDTSDLQPIAHMWYRSAQAWLKLADGLPVYQEQPSFDELLALAQKAGSCST